MKIQINVDPYLIYELVSNHIRKLIKEPLSDDDDQMDEIWEFINLYIDTRLVHDNFLQIKKQKKEFLKHEKKENPEIVLDESVEGNS